jgi:lysozyme
MSIFKQSFPKWIQNQLQKRQDLQATGLNGGFKTNEALVWNQTKQCVIRATSLVDYVISMDDGLGITDGVNEVEFSQLKGSQLAKQFILQGGILNNGQTRSAAFGQAGSAYGDPLLASRGGSDGFGHVPMPGITSLDIATKSAYGSLRQAKLSFVVHNLKQLAIMEMLYMRPGYPVLVEWQWSPYIHSTDGIIHRDHKVSSDIVFAEKVIQQDLYTEIVNLKKESEGNYDGFLGFVTNFGFQARPDGGFDCYSEIVSMGEAIDSLKVGNSSTVLGRLYPGKEFTFKLHKEDEDEEIKNPDILRAILLGLAKFTGTIDTAGGELPLTPQFVENWINNESGELADVIVDIILEKFGPLQAEGLTKDDKTTALGQYVLRKNQRTSAGEFSAPLNTGYVRWDLLAFLINELVIPRPSGDDTPQLQIVQEFFRNDPNNNDEKTIELLKYLKFTGGNSKDLIDLSCDPGVCILPHSLFDPRLKETIDPDQGKIGKAVEAVGDFFEFLWKRTSNAVVALVDEDVDFVLNSQKNNLDLQEEFMYYIGGIYLNTEMLLKAYDSSFKGKDLADVDLGDFFKAVWDEVNTACPLHNFIFKIDNEFPNTAYIMDLPVDNNQLNEIKDKLFTVEVQSSNSVVREYDLQATIPDALKSTVAVHAQNPDTTEDLDDLTFQAFNRNIKNRIFIPPEEEPVKTDKEKEDERKAEEKYQQSETAKEDRRLGVDSRTTEGKIKKRYLLAAEKFNKLTPLYFEIVNADENSSVDDSDDKVTDLKSSLKELQTSTLQLEKSKNKNLGASAVIPLEFTMTLDGISNIIIGSVFKIRGDRLPKAYKDKVAFIVFKEEQSITSGQDWTTKIGGKMIILPTENQGKPIGPSITNPGKKLSPVPEDLPPPMVIENEIAVPDNTFVVPPPPPLGTAERIPVDQLTTSEEGINLIKQFEGFRTNAYVDPGTGGEPITIGYGTTRYADGRKVRMGDVITEGQATEELKHHVEKVAEKDIRRFIDVPLTQFEFDSLSSWTYNVGGGSLQGSTLRRKLNARDYEGAAEEFPRWNKAAGKVLAGLTKRRVAERNLYLTDNPGNLA